MLSFARSAIIAIVVTLPAAGSALAQVTTSQPAAPASQAPFGGFFNRFLPGDNAPPAAPQPAPAPTRAASDEPYVRPNSPFNDGHGGLIDNMRGAHTEGCTGTLCEMFGGSGRITQSMPGQPVPGDAAPALAAEADTVTRRDDDDPPPRPKERCVSPANDPWRCYR